MENNFRNINLFDIDISGCIVECRYNNDFTDENMSLFYNKIFDFDYDVMVNLAKNCKFNKDVSLK